MSKTGPGRFVNPASFQIVREFFLGNHDLPPGEYKEDDLRGKLNVTEKYIPLRQWQYNDHINDYIERVYIWNSSAYEIEDSVLFVVEEDGSKYIKNLAVIPLAKNYRSKTTENFDFESDDWLASKGREILEPLIDPSLIGRRVNIYFDTDVPFIPYYDFNSFLFSLDEYKRNEMFDKSLFPDSSVLSGMIELADRIFEKGVKKFIQDGKVVIYGDFLGGEVNIGQRINKYHFEYAVNNGIIFVGSNNSDSVYDLDKPFPWDSNVALIIEQADLYGNDGEDILHGTRGDDKLYGGDDGDELHGHDGDDELYGEEGDDTLIGGAGDDKLYGEAGDDVLDGGEGDDVVKGGAGNDTFVGGAGKDILDGGEGTDLVSYENADSGTRVELGGEGQGRGAEGDVLRSIENIIGSPYDDVLRADEVDNTIEGRGGNDLIEGGKGDDIIKGEEGDDRLLGGEGKDLIEGGDGDDTLDGGDGKDTLLGGDGQDTYIAGDGDVIRDSDGKGRVTFEGITLGRGVYKPEGKSCDEGGSNGNDHKSDDEKEYKGAHGEIYRKKGGGLEVEYNGARLTIESWKDGDLGITLEDEDPGDGNPCDPPPDDFDDPLVLDLDGDGIELVALEGSGAFFDVDGDGIAERTGWVSPDDGLLAYDRNANGIIDGVDELFGKGETYSARGDTAHEACTGRLHSLRAMNIRDNDTTLACRKLAA